MGSLGRVRLVAIAEWKGGRVAREAKALTASALEWLYPKRAPSEVLYAAILQRAVRCPDPYVQLRGHWIVRRLSPHCSRIELEALGTSRGECRLLEAMGRETANIHVGTEEKRRAILKDLRGRKSELASWGGAGDGRRNRERLASVEGALAELDPASAFIGGKGRAKIRVSRRGGTPRACGLLASPIAIRASRMYSRAAGEPDHTREKDSR
jgi:hypothetical protein